MIKNEYNRFLNMSKSVKIISKNNKAYYNYFILETYEAGIVLTGSEIKAIRQSGLSLDESYVTFKNAEVFLLNAHIAQYHEANIFNHEPKRTRKLLLHKKEIFKLKKKAEEKSLTIIPTKAYFKGSHVKIEIALSRGKKLFDKRQTIKERDLQRDLLKMKKDFNNRR